MASSTSSAHVCGSLTESEAVKRHRPCCKMRTQCYIPGFSLLTDLLLVAGAVGRTGAACRRVAGAGENGRQHLNRRAFFQALKSVQHAFVQAYNYLLSHLRTDRSMFDNVNIIYLIICDHLGGGVVLWNEGVGDVEQSRLEAGKARRVVCCVGDEWVTAILMAARQVKHDIAALLHQIVEISECLLQNHCLK